MSTSFALIPWWLNQNRSLNHHGLQLDMQHYQYLIFQHFPHQKNGHRP